MSTPLGEEFIRIRPDVSRFRTELETQIAAAMRGVQNQVVKVKAQLQQTAAQTRQQVSRAVILPAGVSAAAERNTRAVQAETRATDELAAATRSASQIVLPSGVRSVATANARAIEQQTRATEELTAAERTRGGVVLPPGVRAAAGENARALEQQAAATEDVGNAARVARRDVADFDATQRRASRGGIIVPGAAASIRQQARATEELGAATAQVGRVVLPSGVRSVATRNATAIREQTEATDGLTKASAAAGRVVLPSDVRSVSVANAQGIRAQESATDELGSTAQKTSRSVQNLERLQRRASKSGIIIPGVAAASQRNTQALQQQTQATQQLGNVTQTTTGRLRTFQTVQQQGTQTAGGVILPPTRRTRAPQVTGAVTQATTQQTAALQGLATTTSTATGRLGVFTNFQRRGQNATRDMQRSILTAENAIGRYSRGMLAATAASTGFFRAVSFASGAFLVGATIGATIGSAVQEFNEMTQVAAQTTQLIKATGGAANITAKQVDELSLSVLKLTGVDDELVKQGANVLLTFRNVRNEAGRGNDIFNRAVRAAADISSVFRTDLRGSAVQLGKALQDPERGVTALRRSGISLSQSQRELIKQLVRSGAVLSAQKVILGEVERQVGGASEAIGRTLPGRLRIMREEALNSLGALVKRLTESRTAADLLAESSQGISQGFGAVRATIAAIGPSLIATARGFGRITQSVGGVGAILAAVAAYKALRLVVSASTRVLGLYAAASAGAAQAEFAQAAAAGTVTASLEAKKAAEISAARAAQASLAGMTALAGAFAVAAAASGNWTFAITAGGIALLGLAGKARAAVLGMRAATGAATAMGVASAALGGPLGIAALAAGALAIAIFKFSRNAANSVGSLNRTKEALDGLNQSLEQNNRLRAAVGTARERFGVAQFDVRAAERDVQRAQERLANTRAQPGSLQFQFLQEQLRVAQDNLAKSTTRLTRAQEELDAAREKNRVNEEGQPARVRTLTSELLKQITALRQIARQSPTGRGLDTNAVTRSLFPLDKANQKLLDFGANLRAASNRAAPDIEAITARFEALSQTGTRASRQAAAAIATITSSLRRVPTQRELTIIVRLATRGENVNQILKQLGVVTGADTEQRRLITSVTQGLNATLREQVAIARGDLKVAREKLKTLTDEANKRRETLRTARLELQAARDAVASAKESRAAAIETLAEAQRGLSEAQQSLRDTIRESAAAVAQARQNLADTLRQSRESIAQAISSAREASTQAIQDAKGNLLDLNRSIATSLANLLEKTGAGMDKLSARGQQLRDRIIGGRGGPETLRAAQQVNFNLQRETPVDTDKIKQRFDDLTDSFVRGRINLQTYDKRFNALTRGLDVKKFKQVFGSEAANELLDTIKASRRQAVLIKESPKQIGGAIAQKLINPMRTIKEGEQAIATATRDAARNNLQASNQLNDAIIQQGRDIKTGEQAVADANKAVAKARTDIVKADRQLAAAERRLRQAQHIEMKANTAAISANAKETKQLRIVLARKRALLETKPKPQGNNTKQANRLRAGDIPLKEGAFILDLNGNLFG